MPMLILSNIRLFTKCRHLQNKRNKKENSEKNCVSFHWPHGTLQVRPPSLLYFVVCVFFFSQLINYITIFDLYKNSTFFQETKSPKTAGDCDNF